jgi:hypothetical protein
MTFCLQLPVLAQPVLEFSVFKYSPPDIATQVFPAFASGWRRGSANAASNTSRMSWQQCRAAALAFACTH